MSDDRDRFARARELFTGALAHEGAARDRFLADACRGDAPLLDEVLALLAQHSLDGQHFEPPAWREPADVPERIGPYRVLGLVGQGGMGIVYRARRLDGPPDAPPVALKVLQAGALGPQFERRLQREADVLRRLDHPGIARLLEAGGADGAPFLAMEFVEGVSLTRWRVEQDPPVADRIRLLAELCDAVHAAHDRGVVHRDLKPENILVTADGRPRVLDFGIARLSDADLPAQTLMTQTWQLLGTIRYMSPEQAAGGPAEVDARTDVYALGVIGCELLTGRLPYDLSRLSTPRALLEITTAVPRSLGGELPAPFGALEAVLLHALEKQPADRYATAAALAADLRLVLDGRGPDLRRPGPRARLVRHWRTHPRFRRLAVWLPLAAAAVAVAILATLPSRLPPAVSWAHLYTELEEADRLRHKADASRADFEAAAAVFLRARTELVQLPARPYTIDLHRYIKWRLGEIHYFLGARGHDLAELELARGYWQDARMSAWERGTPLGIDSLAVIRPRVLRLGRHHPTAGVGYTFAAMAGLRAPATNWLEAAKAQDAAREICAEGPGDYHTPEVHALDGAGDLTSTLLDLGGCCVARGAVLDSVPMIREGLAWVRSAAARATIESAEGRTMLHRALGTAYLELAERGAGAAALDSAATHLDRARDLCDPSAGRAYWLLYRIRARLDVARAGAAAGAPERLRALRQARTELAASLAPLEAGTDDLERAESLADRAGVEAALALALPSTQRLATADSLLAAAARLLEPARLAVPWAEYQRRTAEAAAARWRLTGDEAARQRARDALDSARAVVPRLESPSLHRRLDGIGRELAAGRDAGEDRGDGGNAGRQGNEASG